MDNKIRLILAIIALLIILSAVCSCKTVRYIPVKEVRTDTVFKSRKDSIRWIRYVSFTDSIRWRDSVAVTIGSDGNVKRTDTWHWRDHSTNKKDSTLFYKSLYDSLKISKVDSIPKPYPVNKYIPKPLSWWEQTIMNLGYGALIIIVVIVAYFGIKLWNKFNLTSIIKKIM